MFARITWVTIAVALSISAANSATLQDVRGRVFLDRGGGFVPVSGSVTVQPGVRVMTGDSASAQLVIGPNCVLRIPARQTIVVPSDKNCAGGLSGKSGQALLIAGALGAVGLVAIIASDSNDPQPVSP